MGEQIDSNRGVRNLKLPEPIPGARSMLSFRLSCPDLGEAVTLVSANRRNAQCLVERIAREAYPSREFNWDDEGEIYKSHGFSGSYSLMECNQDTDTYIIETRKNAVDFGEGDDW